MPYHLSILLKKETSRITYTFRTIFLDILGFDRVDFFTDTESFRKKDGVKISYDIYEDTVPFLAAGVNLLYETGIEHKKPENFGTDDELPYFYRLSDSKSILPFDFAAMSFWLLTRYEEYQPFVPDIHGRFTAAQSFAYQHNFLHLPLIDLWAIRLRDRLRTFFSDSYLPAPANYSFQPTFDIDYAWAYRNKAIWRNMGALARDVIKMDFKVLTERIAVLRGNKRDPYFSFSDIEAMHKETQKPIFFWLLGDYGKFDKNTDYENDELRKLIKDICSKFKIGIHPSYASNEKENGFVKEKNRLESISVQDITKSRQHFLKLKFPDTYLKLLEIGITDEYSLGYAEVPGFRASVSKSFFWYNLATEQETELRIHPFMIMDVTLNIYLKKNTAEAFEISKRIIDSCRRVGGELIVIWHNNSLCEQKQWQGWTEFYRDLLSYASNK
jgi:hypothetical protein